jgi:hypothetical protein
MAHARPFRSFAILFASVCIAGAGVCSSAAYEVRRIIASVREISFEVVKAVVEKFAQPALRLSERPVELVQACAHAQRQAKRDRPRMMPGWRMCPST